MPLRSVDPRHPPASRPATGLIGPIGITGWLAPVGAYQNGWSGAATTRRKRSPRVVSAQQAPFVQLLEGEVPRAVTYASIRRDTTRTQAMNCERLFDTFNRWDTEPAAHSESRFAFLNRIDEPFFNPVRELLEEWFTHLPDEAKCDLRGRFRSSHDWQMMSAFWELYLHESFRRSGFGITTHPHVPRSTNRPDFLVQQSGHSVYVEAVVSPGASDDAGLDRRRQALYDGLNNLRSPNFLLDAHLIQAGSSAPSVRRLRAELQDWLASLDPDRVTKEIGDRNVFLAGPQRSWQCEEWNVAFTAIPKDVTARNRPGIRPLAYLTEGDVTVVDRRGPLRNALDRKVRHYGSLDRPLVIALLCREQGVSQMAVGTMLHGQHGSKLTHRQLADVGLEGFFSTRTAGKVSAVLAACQLEPWYLVRRSPCIWPNPTTRHPLDVHLPWTVLGWDEKQDEPVLEADGVAMSEVFGLEQSWPGPDRAFESRP